MPVRIPDIPGLANTRIGAPLMSPAAAAAPGRALGDLAESIASVSRPFAKVALDLQEKENFRQESAARTQLDEARSKLFIDLQKDPDPANHIQRTDAFLAEQKQLLDQPGMAPLVRDRLTVYFDEWASNTRTNVATDAARLAQRRAGLQLQNEIDAGFESNNPETVGRAVRGGVAAGVLLPEEAEAIERKFATKQRKDAHRRAAIEDPEGVLAGEYKTGNAVEDYNLEQSARSVIQQQVGEADDKFKDMLATGEIDDPAQVDEFFPDLRPAVREQMKAAVARRGDAEFKALQITPAYQASVVGKVSAMLADYSTETDGFDAAYVEISDLIATLPESPTRTELSRNLRAKREGDFKKMEDWKDYHRAQFDDLSIAGVFGISTKETDVQPFVDAGLLNDVKKLRSFGFSTGQAETITKLQGKSAAQMAEFRRLWYQREDAGNALSGTPAFKIAEAVAGRQDKLVTTDLAAREKARRAYGSAKMKFEDWLSAHPEATEEQVRAMVIDLAKAAGTSTPGFIDSIIAAPPVIDGIDIDGSLLPPPPED